MERLPIEQAEECLRQLEERLITVNVLGLADAQDLADECGFTQRQCEAVMSASTTWPGEPSMERSTRARRDTHRAQAGSVQPRPLPPYAGAPGHA